MTDQKPRTPTPRTDAVSTECEQNDNTIYADYWKALNHARQLETELSDALRHTNEHIADKHRILREYEEKAEHLRRERDEAVAESEKRLQAHRNTQAAMDERCIAAAGYRERAEKAEQSLLAAEADAGRVDWFEKQADKGAAPSLIYDDNGNWAVAYDGSQNIRTQDTHDLAISHFVSASAFKPTVREAIDAAIDKARTS